MPILDSKPTVPPKAVPVEPTAIAAEVRNAVVDSRYIPMSSLLTHIEGASWTVDYYSQVLDLESETSDLQLNQQAVYQQYKLIRHLELKVQGELTPQQDEQSRNMIITGSAVLYPGVRPNNGDIFLADIGDGRIGVFTITRTEKKAIFKDTCYQIDYMLRDYLTTEYRDGLAKKVVKESVFVRDFIHHGQNPVMATSDFDQITALNAGYQNLLFQYMSDFFNVEYQTLCVPNQTNVTYDPFMVKALLSVLDNSENNTIHRIRALNVDGNVRYKENNLWTCLTNLNDDVRELCFHKAGLSPSGMFKESAQFDGIYYSGIQDVVYPIDSSTLTVVDMQYSVLDPLVPGRLLPGIARNKELRRVLVSKELKGFHYAPTEAPVGIEALPDIHPVNKDDFYVLSEAFYDDLPVGLSKLEQLTLCALKGESMHKPTLLNLVKTCKRWNNLERFYYIPILFILIKTALRDY
jgi:hypothetical protein